MARIEDRLPANVPGEWFVDSSCIDCETCRFVAPATFAAGPDAMSYVHRQPVTGEEQLRAAMALVACPTSSIGSTGKTRAREAARTFPEPIEPGSHVHYCGYAAEQAYGAQSWLVVREDGNVLVDSPRFARPLVERIEALGGVRWMFLTHRDDVGDHEAFARRFGCERIIHADDVTAETRGVETKVRGRDAIPLAADLLMIPVPGHSRGSMALLHDDVLFSGDHVWWSAADGALEASRRVSWYSWPEQIRSVEKLLAHDFEWVLPGHGFRWKAPDVDAMREEVRRLVARMRTG